jgi:hypothetical protein
MLVRDLHVEMCGSLTVAAPAVMRGKESFSASGKRLNLDHAL